MVHILGSLLRQLLATSQEPILDEVIQKLQKIQFLGGSLGKEDALALLKIRFHQLRRVYICVDAVDELEPKVRQEVLDIYKEFSTYNNTRLFITGRDHIEGEVQKRFKVEQGYKVKISANYQDIREFVRQQIKEDEDLNPEAMDKALAQDIEDAIIEKSKGM